MPLIQVGFTVQYAKEDAKEEKRNYSCTFDVTDYATLFKIQAKVTFNIGDFSIYH